MLSIYSGIIILICFIVYKTIIVISERENIIVERLGKYQRTLTPGIYFLIPFIDFAAYKQEMREQVIDIPSQSVITKDNIQVEIDGLLYIKVMDPKKASYGIGNYLAASINLAQTTMRSEVGKITLGSIFSERDEVNAKIISEIDKASDPWGVKVLRYEIKDIAPSLHVVETLEKQMEAEREKRAEITRATAEKEKLIQLDEITKLKEKRIIDERQEKERLDQLHKEKAAKQEQIRHEEKELKKSKREEEKRLQEEERKLKKENKIRSEEEKEKRLKDFEGFGIDNKLMNLAKKDAIFLHCLPAYRGLEVSEDIFEKHSGIVFDEAQRAWTKHQLSSFMKRKKGQDDFNSSNQIF